MLDTSFRQPTIPLLQIMTGYEPEKNQRTKVFPNSKLVRLQDIAFVLFYVPDCLFIYCMRCTIHNSNENPRKSEFKRCVHNQNYYKWYL